MCWSWEVSLAFGLAQVVSITYLCYRNKYIDRYWAMASVPVCVQELCQFLVWKWGIQEETDRLHCNGINFVSARVIIMTIYAIPVLIAVLAVATMLPTTFCLRWFWRTLLCVETFIYFVTVIFELADSEFCIFVGAHGHLDWVEALRSDLPIFIGFNLYFVGILAYYTVPLFSAALLYTPRWVTFVPMMSTCIVFVALLVIYDTEGYSIWCWSASMIQIWTLAYVPLAHYITNKFTVPDIEQHKDGIMRFCFSGSHRHYAIWTRHKGMQKLATRDMDAVPDEEEEEEENSVL